MGSLFLFTLNTGILCGFILTNYLKPLWIVPVTCACLLLIYISILLKYLHNSPQYLLKIGLIDKAKSSLQFYWNSLDQKDFELEGYFESLRQSIVPSKADNEQKENMLVLVCEYFLVEECHVVLFFYVFLTVQPKHFKAILIGFGLVATNQFSGAFSIFNYSITILEQSEGFSLDSGTSTMVLGLLQILGTYSATLTVDRFGRKVVMMISASFSAIGLLTAGIFDYLSYEFDTLKSHSWILVLSLASVIYFANMGVCSVCYVVLVEVLPFKVSFMYL